MEETVPRKMRRLNTSVDVIPIIQGTSSDDFPQLIEKRKKSENKKPNNIYTELKSRVQKYLSANEDDKERFDPSKMAASLLKDYPDYNNKKNVEILLQVVRRAHEDESKLFSNKTDFNYDDDDSEDDEIEIQSDNEVVSGDVWGNELRKLFRKSPTNNNNKNGSSTSDKELIDISSDDDNDDDGATPAVELKEITSDKITQVKNNTIATTQSVLLRNPNYNCHGIKRKNPTKSIVPDLMVRVVDGPNVEEAKQQVGEGGVGRGKKRSRDKSAEKTITLPQLKKRKDIAVKSHEKKYKFCDIGGNTKVLKSIVRLLKHIKHPEVLKHLSAPLTRSILLHGPPGCGKTLIAHAIAGELDVPLLKTSGIELIVGEKSKIELRIRELFEQALSLAPCVLFFDELLLNSQKEIEHRIVRQLIQSLDELNLNKNGDKILVLSATNRLENIDPSLRRPGKFDYEISIDIPDKNCRSEILEIHCKNVPLSGDIDLSIIAGKTSGFVGADLVSLVSEAAIAASNRFFQSIKKKNEMNVEKVVEEEKEIEIKESKDIDNSKNLNNDKEAESTTGNSTTEKEEKSQVIVNKDDVISPESSTNDKKRLKNNVNERKEMLELLHIDVVLSNDDLNNLKIENIDFERALKVVQPWSKREGFVKVPNITWDNIGSLKKIRQELQMALLGPLKYPDIFATLDYNPSTSILLCGPPGCGKTLLAKAIANEAGMNFISINGGLENEEAVKQCFTRARNTAPCVIFFDDIDALCPKRTNNSSTTTLRIVNKILTEMDDFEGRKGVNILAATNRPDILDEAVMRPGRFESILYVGLPRPDDRVDILRVLTKNGTVPKLADDVSLEVVGRNCKCNGYTGADLYGLVKQAVNAAVKEFIGLDSSGVTQVHMRHFEIAFNKVRPSVSEKEAEYYEKLRKQYGVEQVEVGATTGEGQYEDEDGW